MSIPLTRPDSERTRVPDGSPSPGDPYAEAIDIAALVRPLWAARWFLFGCAIVGVAVGLALALQRAPVYEAIATLMVRREGGSTTQPNTSSPAMYRSLLEGNTFAARVIERFHLDRPPYGYNPQTFVSEVLSAEEIRNTDLLRIRLRLGDKELASNVANAFADMAVELSQQLTNPPAVLEAARQQMVSAQARMQQAADRLLTFKRTSQLDAAKTDATAALAQRADILELIVNIESQRARLAAAEQELKRAPPRLTEPRSVNAETPLWRYLAERRAVPVMQPKRAELTTTGAMTTESKTTESKTPESRTDKSDGSDLKLPEKGPVPPVRDPSARVDLSDPYANPVYQVLQYEVAMSRTALAGLERRRQALVTERHLGADQLSALTTLYARQIQLARLETEHDLALRLYQEVALRYEQMRLQSDVKATQLVIVDRAVPPEQPMARGRTRLVLTWLLAATALGVALVFARHLLRAPTRAVS